MKLVKFLRICFVFQVALIIPLIGVGVAAKNLLLPLGVFALYWLFCLLSYVCCFILMPKLRKLLLALDKEDRNGLP